MRYRFTPLGKRRLKRFFKRQPMDTCFELDEFLAGYEQNDDR